MWCTILLQQWLRSKLLPPSISIISEFFDPNCSDGREVRGGGGGEHSHGYLIALDLKWHILLPTSSLVRSHLLGRLENVVSPVPWKRKIGVNASLLLIHTNVPVSFSRITTMNNLVCILSEIFIYIRDYKHTCSIYTLFHICFFM